MSASTEGSESNEIILETEEETKNEDNSNWSFRKNTYAMLVVLFVLLIRMTNQWHRKSLTYAFGFAMPDGFPMD
jgi:hypothetical protein